MQDHAYWTIRTVRVLHERQRRENNDDNQSNGEKDLGVVFDSSLNFRKHINEKVKKANRNLGIIMRTFHCMSKDMFLKLYKALVRPHLEYASSVWSPRFKKDQISIEAVQRRATRMVQGLENLSYPQRLRKLGIPSLEYRRIRTDMIQTYKIMHNIDKLTKTNSFLHHHKHHKTQGETFLKSKREGV